MTQSEYFDAKVRPAGCGPEWSVYLFESCPMDDPAALTRVPPGMVRLEGADTYTCTRGPNKGRKRWKRPLQNNRVVWLKKEEYQAVWREAKAQEEASHG